MKTHIPTTENFIMVIPCYTISNEPRIAKIRIEKLSQWTLTPDFAGDRFNDPAFATQLRRIKMRLKVDCKKRYGQN